MNSNPRPLRVAYIFQQFPVPTETFAVSDVLALRGLGHEIAIYTVKPRRRGESKLLNLAGVPNDLPINRPTLRGLSSWPQTMIALRRDAAKLVRALLPHLIRGRKAAVEALLCIPRVLEIARHIEQSDFDVVHVFWARHAGMVLPVLRTRGARPLRSAFVGAYDLVARDYLVGMTMASAEVAFSHAEMNRCSLHELAPQCSDVHIVRRGIPIADLAGEAARDPYLWVTASALVPSKNVEGVIRAFVAARNDKPLLRLKVFGDGDDRRRLEQLTEQLQCATAVEFVGHVSRRELFAEMLRASLFLFLSKKPSERLPNVVKEALWAGCAVIASRSEGIEEVIPDERIGFVVDPDDLSSLQRKIRDVMAESASAAEKRRLAARSNIEERFSSRTNMARYAQAWQAVLDGPRK